MKPFRDCLWVLGIDEQRTQCRFEFYGIPEITTCTNICILGFLCIIHAYRISGMSVFCTTCVMRTHCYNIPRSYTHTYIINIIIILCRRIWCYRLLYIYMCVPWVYTTYCIFVSGLFTDYVTITDAAYIWWLDPTAFQKRADEMNTTWRANRASKTSVKQRNYVIHMSVNRWRYLDWFHIKIVFG